MKRLNIREIRKALPHLDQILEEEGELTITRRDEEIARVTPIVRRATPSHRKLREGMPRMKKASEKLIRADRDARHERTIYFDTSALAKWYIHKEQSEEVEAFIQGRGPIAISELTIVEMATLLGRRCREGNFDPEMEARIFSAFQEDVRNGYLLRHPFLEGLSEAALLMCVQLSRTAICILDLLHLAIAREIQADVLATADRIMAEAAAILDLRVAWFGSRNSFTKKR